MRRESPKRYTGVVGRFILLFVLLSPSVTLTGCGIAVSGDQIIQSGIEALEDESANWRHVVEETRDRLIKAGHELVARDVDSVLQRAINASGIGVSCVVDHLGTSLRDNLIQIKAELLGEPIPPLVPYLCDWDPDTINYDWVKDGSQTDMTFWGYNLDPDDPPRLYVLNETDSSLIDSIRRLPVEPTGGIPAPVHYTTTVAMEYAPLPSIEEPLSLEQQRLDALDEVSAGIAAVGSPYKMTVDLTDLPLTANSEYLVLDFGNGERWSYNVTHPTEPEPPPPVFAAGSIRFYTYGPLAQGQTDTGIPAANYDCGIVGLWADDGDIDEKDADDILIARAFTEAGTWRIHVNFNTEAAETWEKVVLMCLSTEYRETGYRLRRDVRVGGHSQPLEDLPTDQYFCGVVGMSARNGDIAEEGVQKHILLAYAEDEGEWTVKADFASESQKDESWVVDVLCVIRDEELFHWERISGLNGKHAFETDVSTSEYACGIVGMQARNGDINEKGSGKILEVSAGLSTVGHWVVRTDFRTHNNAEDWTVDLLCARNTIATYSLSPWFPY